MIAGCNGRLATNQHQDEDTHGAATDMLLLIGEDAEIIHGWRSSKTDLAWSALPTDDRTGFLIDSTLESTFGLQMAVLPSGSAMHPYCHRPS
jgi:hypothetical protein